MSQEMPVGMSVDSSAPISRCQAEPAEIAKAHHEAKPNLKPGFVSRGRKAVPNQTRSRNGPKASTKSDVGRQDALGRQACSGQMPHSYHLPVRDLAAPQSMQLPWMHGTWPALGAPGMPLGIHLFPQVQCAADAAFRQCGSSNSGSQSSKASQLLQTPSQQAQMHQRLWQQMALARGKQDLLQSQACPSKPVSAASVWGVFVGDGDYSADNSEARSSQSSLDAQKSVEELLRRYLVSPHTAFRKDSLANCEAASECSTADTTASWTAFHAEDVALAEWIAAVLMDRESASLGSDSPVTPSSEPHKMSSQEP